VRHQRLRWRAGRPAARLRGGDIPDGYPVQLRIPYILLNPFQLRPTVAVPSEACREAASLRPGDRRIRRALRRRRPAAHFHDRLRFGDAVVWHSVADFTRDGARYAAPTAGWPMQQRRRPGGYMPTHVPPMIDMDQFQTGAAGIQVQYFQADPATGA